MLFISCMSYTRSSGCSTYRNQSEQDQRVKHKRKQSDLVTMSNTEPIDFIDLTQDSPTNEALRLRRNNVNVNTTEIPRMRRRYRKQRDFRENTELLVTSEIIDLEANNVPAPSGPFIVNESVQGDELLMLTCPICLEKLSSDRKPTSTKCGHIFCEKCLKLAVQKLKRCPTCQGPVKLGACTRLYF